MRFSTIPPTAAVAICLFAASTRAQETVKPAPATNAADAVPMLRLEAGGPTSFVTSLAFNPQTGTLYSGGWDKVVRAWEPAGQEFTLDPAATYRVPVGPGTNGFINAVAVSPDGLWLAVGGKGLPRGASDLQHPGLILPASSMSPEARLDEGKIHLFNTRTQTRAPVGHTGPILALAFAPAYAGKAPVLISIGQERKPGESEIRSRGARTRDIGKGGYLGGQMLPDLARLPRPGIAAWHTGAALSQLRVAVACGDGQLRLWDTSIKDSNRAIQSVADGPTKDPYNSTAQWWPEQNRLITGSLGQLKLWNVAVAPTGQAIQLPNRKDVPQAVALFSSKKKGPIDRAAVAVKFKKDANSKEMVRLVIVDLNASQVMPNSDIPLWDGTGVTPTLAASPSGGRLAVAGNDDHRILMLTLGDMAPAGTNIAVLQGKGIEPRSASFVKKDGSLGVLIGGHAKAAPGGALPAPAESDMVFDPKGRRVSGDVTGWELAQTAVATWRYEVKGIVERKPVIAIFHNNTSVGRIEIPGNHRLTDCALLPPQAPDGVPIMAVATHDLRQPLLQLFNAVTGFPVRESSGHEYLIHAVAFSDDGKLLASAAGDQTVCIWNMADLDSVVGNRAALGDLQLREEGQSLVVVAVKPGGPNSTGQIASGDALTGWVKEDGVAPIESLLDFYRQISRSKPGAVISLRRQRAGQASDTVRLTLGQGVDERKPLVTLFVTQDQQNWIGWSPLGPYESSGEAVEKLLGWHFNTGLPTRPTRFALAEEYQNLRREGLIEQLLRDQALAVEERAAIKRPVMSVRLLQRVPEYEVQTAEGNSPLRLVGREAELDLEIAGLKADHVSRVAWSMDDEEPRSMQPISQQTWAAQLGDLPLERCESHRIRLSVTTNEAQPQTFIEQVSIVYQPLPPALEAVVPEKQVTAVAEKMLTLKAQARSRESQTAGFDVSITNNGEPVAKEHFTGQGEIEHALTLRPGDNLVRVVARNADAKACEDETVLVRQITHTAEMGPPPELNLKAFVPGGDRQPLENHEDTVLVVDVPTLMLEGQITADAPLLRAGWTLGKGEERACSGFAEKKAASFEVHEQITLEPGPQTLRCEAQAEGSMAREVSLKVDYRPRLPELIVDPPPQNDLYEGRDPKRITLNGRLSPTEKQQPFEVIVVLNNEPVGKPLAIEGNSFSAEVDLGDGENRVELQLSNAWGAKSKSDPIWVRFLRPPRIVSMGSLPQQVDGPLVDLEFVVESPAELALTELRINDWILPLEAAVVESPGPKTGRWKVAVRDVPLQLGANTIRPLAANSDGWSIETQTATVNVMLPPPAKAEIEIAPMSDRTVEPQLDFKFVVRSQTQFKRVEVRNGGQSNSVDVTKQTAEPQIAGRPKTWRLEAVEKVKLADGVNRLEVVVVNQGGQTTLERTVTFVRPPVEITIDHLESSSQPGKILKPLRQEGGRAMFAEAAPDGNLWLHGRVRWPDAASRRPNQFLEVQVFVNGFLQLPVPLKPDAGRANDLEWAWKTRIRLNHEKQNEVSVRLIGVAHVADSRLDFKVNCDKPDTRQRLHLLVVGVGENDRKALEELALGAVHGERTTGDQIKAPAFDKGWIYLRSSGYVDPPVVMGQLERIKHHIGDRNSADSGTDVLMVYFRGPEAVDQQGQLCLLTSSKQLSTSIKERQLLDVFRAIPGAQLFLLDVQRPIAQEAESGFRWRRDSQTAVLRYIWVSGGALAVGNPPKDARLLDAVSNAQPRLNELGQLETEIVANSRRAREKYPSNFQDELIVPPALRKLVLAK